MTLRWSSIHEQLGIPPQDLTYQHITDAAAQHLPETDRLDWKSIITTDQDEIAKDIATFANTRGGLLVYGVTEDRTTGRADNVRGVNPTDAEQRRLRSTAASRIRPMVAGLEFTTLTDSTNSVLVLSVPQSPDAPHFVGQDRNLGAPFRDGTQARWMTERDIERAYRDRFMRRDNENHHLTGLIDEARDHLDLDRGAWMVGSARPRTPVPAVGNPPARSDVGTILESALRRSAEILPGNDIDRYRWIRELGNDVHNPRVGLRRWLVWTTTDGQPDALSNLVYVGLHHDGSVVFAVALEGWFAPVITEQHQVICPSVESFAIDLVALVDAYGRRMGAQGPMSFRMELLRRDDSRQFSAISRTRYGHFAAQEMNRAPGSRTVRRFVPILGEVPVAAEPEVLRETATLLASDVLHQFGVGNLTLLR